MFARVKWDEARAAANFLVVTPATFGVQAAHTKATRVVTSTYKKLQHAETNVMQVEDQLGIEVRWTSNHHEYQAIVSKLRHRDYRLALDELE